MQESFIFIMILLSLAVGAVAIAALPRLSAVIKIPLIILTITMSLLALIQTQNYRGHVREIAELPSEVKVLKFIIGSDKKTIRMLMNDLTDQEDLDLFILVDYEAGLHKALSQGKKAAKGEPFKLVTKQKGDEGGKGKGKEDKKGKKASSLSAESKTFEVFPLPSPLLIPKN